MTHISKLSIKFAIKKSIALMSSKISYIVNKSFRSYLTATILTLVIGQISIMHSIVNNNIIIPCSRHLSI